MPINWAAIPFLAFVDSVAEVETSQGPQNQESIFVRETLRMYRFVYQSSLPRDGVSVLNTNGQGPLGQWIAITSFVFPPYVLSSPLGGGSLFRIWGPGDSIREGFNGGDTAAGHGLQYHLARRLRAVRGDICYVGTQQYANYGTSGVNGLNNPIGSVNPGEYSPMDWENEGHSGFTMAQVQANLAGWLATIATTPDIVEFGLGANTGGHTAATMANVDLPNLVSACRALLPKSVIIVSTVPPQGVSAATIAGYNNLIIANASAGLPPFNSPTVRFVDTCSDFTVSECGPDSSVHPNQFGYAKLADRLADAIESILPPPKGPTWPRERRPRVMTTEQGILFSNAADTATGINPGCDIGANSFAVDFEITPMESQIERGVGVATFKHILSAGGSYLTGMSVIANGNDLEIYLGAGGPVLQDIPGSFGKPGVPVRVLVYFDNPHGIGILFVDGTIRGVVTGLAAWNFALGAAFTLGNNGVIGQDAYPCIIRDVRFHRSAQGLQTYSPGTIRLMAEKSAIDGIPLSGTSAWYRCDDTPTGTTAADYGPIAGGVALTLTGAQFTSAPEPGSLPEPSCSLEVIEPAAPAARDMIGPLCTLDLDAAMGITFAAGAKISNWQDQSLAGAHSFAQATAGNQPTKVEDGINGRPAIVFATASTTKLLCADALSTFIQAGNWHMFIVAQYAQFNRNDAVNLYANDSLISESTSRWGIGGRSGGGTPLGSGWKVHAGPVYDYTSEVTIASNLPFIFEYCWDNTALSFQYRVAGGVLGTTPQNSPGITKAGVLDLLTGTLALGVDYTRTQYSDCMISRVIIANQKLPVQVATRVRQQLGQFYRI